MEDNYYYRMKSIAADIDWLRKTIVDEGFENLLNSETKRKSFRNLVIETSRNIEIIRSKVGEEFHPEMGGVAVLETDKG